jgi:4,5-epoxidase
MSVLVVGAGPTGLTLACALLQRGVPVRVVDSADSPATTSRAMALQPRGQEVLHRIGALAHLPQSGIPTMAMSMYSGNRRIITIQLQDHGRDGKKQPSMLSISQADIEAALRDRFSELGGSIEWGTGVVGVDAGQDSVDVTVAVGGATPSIVTSDWLVGCDGAHSTVRKAVGIGFPGAALIESFLLADVHADLPIGRDGVSVWLHPQGMLAALPLPGDDLWRLMADASGNETDVSSEIGRVLATRSGMAGAQIGPAEWTSLFRIQRRLVERYRRGRVFLAGDAAHIHSPFGGQGLNTGIGDAENLAWKLVLVAKGIADEQLLDTYQAERRPVAKTVVSGTTSTTKILLGTNVAARWMRDRVILPVVRSSVVQKRLFAVASQLSVSYRRGPLSSRARIPVGLRPGDRVPDMVCRRPDGTATSLHGELAGRWALVNPRGGISPPADLGEELVVLEAAVSDTLLIRPDAHLAWRHRYATIGLDSWLHQSLGLTSSSARPIS